MKPESIHLKVRSHPKNLKRIRGLMADITSKAGLSKEASGHIILAIDEACSNVIKHSYNNDYTQKIDLNVKLETNCLTISIVNDGIKFDCSSIEARDINEIKPGGLGVYIINHAMDTVEYSQTPEGLNKLTMVKKLNL
ncbi:MAG: ATP-binding protein [Desulfobacula sp.]|nr:ATP-binding protein [Desulfobacula sp.]MCK5349818.1 ATP-binding protein [Desulfobacula sp.]